MKYNRVLTIAGSDSGGGAGIQADIKTITALKCYAASVITAVTAQNTLGVQQICAIPAEMVSTQIHSVLDDIGADVIKIGMLHSAEVIRAVADTLGEYDKIPIVLDPVMVSTSRHKLIEDNAVKALCEILIPKAYVITPNLPEAEALLGRTIGNEDDVKRAARELKDKFGVSVLLKGGHLDETKNVNDILIDVRNDELVELSGDRVVTQNTHGTGCTLSSAIASFLAQGNELTEACALAKKYITHALAEGAKYEIGEGHGPVKHF